MFDYILARLGEAATWRGFVDFAMAAGLALTPDQATAIVTAGLALRGAIGSFLPDRAKKPEVAQ